VVGRTCVAQRALVGHDLFALVLALDQIGQHLTVPPNGVFLPYSGRPRTTAEGYAFVERTRSEGTRRDSFRRP